MHAGGRPLVTLVLPAFNEAGVLEANVELVMDYLASLEHRYRFEVLLINDGSSDESGPIAERLRRRFDTLRLINHPLNFGLGQAFKTAFAVSRGDYVITFDVDLSYAPEHIGLLLETIVRERAKLVLASAYMPGGKVTNVPWQRHVLSRLGNRFLRFFARGGFSTLTCMVRAYDGPFVRRLFLRSTGMDIMPELVQKTMILNGRIVEVPAHLDWSRQLEAGPRRGVGSETVTLLTHRNGQPVTLHVDLSDIFVDGDVGKDEILQAGDAIYVNRAPAYYIYGQVQRPGMYAIERGMTVAQAIAKAGGLTARGTERGLKLQRRNAVGEVETFEVKLDDAVRADDLLQVRESLF